MIDSMSKDEFKKVGIDFLKWIRFRYNLKKIVVSGYNTYTSSVYRNKNNIGIKRLKVIINNYSNYWLEYCELEGLDPMIEALNLTLSRKSTRG